MKKFETTLLLNAAFTACIVIFQVIMGSGCAVTSEYANSASRCLDDTVAASCTGMRLTARNLTGSDLSGKSLASADLRYSVMNQVKAQATDLAGANLSRTKLMNADLRRANLEKADLTFADLRGADLRGAKLAGADLNGADIRGAMFDTQARVDLSKTIRTDRERFSDAWAGSLPKLPEFAGVSL